MQLMQHNEITLSQVNAYVGKGMNCCVVNPCGSGKTSVASEFIRQHEGSTFLMLTKQKNAADYYRRKDAVFSDPRVHIVTYNRMHNDVAAGGKNLDLYDRDYYIVDEAHYIGASLWREDFLFLKSKFNPITIGLTATPQRFEDQGTDRNVVEEYFDGNYAGNFTAKQLQRQGVFVEPDYILSMYNFEDAAKEQWSRILSSDLNDDKKIGLLDELEALVGYWKRDSSPKVIFQNNLPKYMYKPNCNRIIVYVSSVAELKSKRAYIEANLRAAFAGKQIKSYEYTYVNTEDTLDAFLEEDSSYIKVLFTIDKIMETVHIDDVRVLIMLRPSLSNRIIVQQFGRINTIGNKSTPLIIDMVDNLGGLNKIVRKEDPRGKATRKKVKETGDEEESFDEEKRKNTRKSAKAKLKFKYFSSYSNIFTKIDKTIRSVPHYELEGFCGTLKELCFVFDADYDKMQELVGDKDIPTAIALSKKKGKRYPSRYSGRSGAEVQPMSSEDIEYAQKNIRLINDFLLSKDIADEDMRQDLYLCFLNAVADTKGKYEREFQKKIAIVNKIRQCFLRKWRDKIRENRMMISMNDFDADIELWTESPIEEVSSTIVRETLRDFLGEFQDRERTMVEMYYGLIDGKEHSLEECGDVFGVTRERCRQIIAKALRKLRHPSYSKRLIDFLH